MNIAVFLAVPATIGGIAASGAVFALARRHFRPAPAAAAALSAGTGLALGWCYAAWVVVPGLLAGLAAYGLARLRLDGGRALLISIGVTLACTFAAGAMLRAALDAMG
ncbi:hypothetical protein [Amycolatopsis benzoatilytica]|uniref:hypothetical protein n=1 Tax=Amycolatopsis benzoatilytica TaxID=346045 RepID=UPI00035F32E8|nr:hypothetical protein [Amycolatopsis benzoatilytica]